MTVRKLIRHSISQKLIFIKHPQIILYLSEHLNDLLELSFSEDLSNITNDAFNIIKHIYTLIINSFLNLPDFHYTVNEVLNRDNPSSRCLSRVCSLTQLILLSTNSNFPSSCGFILQLIKYINDLSILYFFEEIILEEFSYSLTHKWISENGFSELILNEIQSITLKNNKNIYLSKSYQKMKNLLIIFKYCKSSTILRKKFEKIFSLQIIISLPRISNYIEDEKWDIIRTYYTKNTYLELNYLFNYLINIISEPFNKISNFNFSILKIFIKILKKNYNLNNFLKSPLHQILLRFIFQFYENTFLMNIILKFLEISFQKFPLNIQYAETILPPLLYEGTKSTFFMLFSFSCEVFEKAINAASIDKNFKKSLISIEGFEYFISNQLKKRRKLLIDDYGGRKPFFWNF